MSKFIDDLKRAAQAGPQPMGFRAAPAPTDRPRLRLVAVLDDLSTADNITDLVAGADAGLLKISGAAAVKAAKSICQSKTAQPWGAWLKSPSDKAQPLTDAGCDFIVFPPDTAFTALKGDGGRVLAISLPCDDGLLRAVNDLPVNAVLVSVEETADFHLTWRHLMLLRHAADLLGKPLLAAVPAKINEDELLALWEAGVMGIAVGASGKPGISGLRQVIDKITFPSAGKRRKAAPSVPYISGEKPAVEEGEEEDDE
jgi:hypothetical protein